MGARGILKKQMVERRAECHPESKHYAKGLCSACYSRDKSARFRALNPGYATAKSREWAEANRELVNERARDYYERAGAKVRRKRLLDTTVRERTLAVARQWHRDNPDKSAALAKAKKAKRRAAGRVSAADIRRIVAEQDGKCFWCEAVLGDRYHADHYIPVARGGTSDPDNIVASCPTCNFRRRDNLPTKPKGKS